MARGDRGAAQSEAPIELNSNFQDTPKAPEFNPNADSPPHPNSNSGIGQPVTAKRFFCGVCEVSCHWWIIFVLFPLYLSLASLALVGFFHNMGVSWIKKQNNCISGMEVMEQCVLDFKVTGGNGSYIGWRAHVNSTDTRSLILFPDCRFIIKDDYLGYDDQKFGIDMSRNQTVECWLPSDWRTQNKTSPRAYNNVTGILSQKTWESNTAPTGLWVTVGTTFGFLLCFILCFMTSWRCSRELEENCVVQLHDPEEARPSQQRVWLRLNTFYWTINPFHFYRFGVPISAIWKLLVHLMIMIIIIAVTIGQLL